MQPLNNTKKPRQKKKVSNRVVIAQEIWRMPYLDYDTSHDQNLHRFR